ncbi:MAG: sulfatase-like hydrolase/transferase [Pirellulaceae bacterium]
MFPPRIKQARNRNLIPPKPRIAPEAVALPGYVPDLPEVRADFAIYHDIMTHLDQQVGQLLNELEALGLADETIVFYFSDHGGPTPRGKRYLQDSGVRVPLIVHAPAKYQHLLPFVPGSSTNELVSFVDFAPTLLSVVGVTKPPQMQGRSFLGDYRTPALEDDCVFLYADRFDEIPGMRRAITNGRYKYIRCFTPFMPGAPYSNYPLQMESWAAWKEAAVNGTIDGPELELWQKPQPIEYLYDLDADPDETCNLAASAEHVETLSLMREKLKAIMVEYHDLGAIPEGMLHSQPSSDEPSSSAFQHEQIEDYIEAAFIATSNRESLAKWVDDRLANSEPVLRYWAFVAMRAFPELNSDKRVGELGVDNEHATNAIMIASLNMERKQADLARAQFTELLDSAMDKASLQLLVNTITDLGMEDIVSDVWLKSVRESPNSDEYIKRFAERLFRSRK